MAEDIPPEPEDPGEIITVTAQRLEIFRDYTDLGVWGLTQETINALEALANSGSASSTQEICKAKVNALVKQCVKLYTGLAIGTSGFCALIGSRLPGFGAMCGMADGMSISKATSWCEAQGKNKMSECGV